MGNLFIFLLIYDFRFIILCVLCVHIIWRIKMNITLSADKTLIEKARRYAKKQNTTLNNLVRAYLKKITGQADDDKNADEFEIIALEHGGKSSKDYKFNREEIYKRAK